SRIRSRERSRRSCQESDPESDRGGRVGALLDSRSGEGAGFACAFADPFRGVGRGFLRLPIKILKRTFRLPRPLLPPHLQVTGRASESLFNLIANFLGGPRNAIVSHGHPPEIRGFNGRRRGRFPRPRP